MSTIEQQEPVVQKEDVRGDKKGARQNKGSVRSPKGDRYDTTGFKKHPHGNNPRRNNNNNQQYIRKAQQGDEQLPNDNQKPRNNNRQQYQNRYEKVSIYDWDRSKITLETPIPERPKEKEILKEPRKEELNKQADEIDKQIDNAINKKNKKIQDILSQDKNQKQEIFDQKTPIQKLLTEQIEILKQKREEFEKYKKEHQDMTDQIEAVFKRQNELRGKMKKCLNEKQILSELQALQKKFDNEKLSNQEERRIVSQIEDLKLSLPHAAPLQKLEDEKVTLEKEAKGSKGKMNAAYKALKQAQEKVDEYRANLDDLRKQKQDNQGKSTPEIELIKTECSNQVDELKKKKNELYTNFSNQMKAYKDQQELFRYIEYVKRQVDYLRKQEKKKKEEEERKKREEEERLKEEQNKKNRYLQYVEMAETLIKYVEKLGGKNQEKRNDQQDANQPQSQQKQLNKEDIEKLVKSEKMTVLVSRKDLPDQSRQLFGGQGLNKGQKKNQQQQQQPQQQQQQQQQKSEIQVFTHTYEILQFFDKLSVSAPVVKEDVDRTLTLLEEKRQYYVDLPNQENAPQEHEKKQHQGDRQQHHQKKQHHAKQIDFDESSFPTIN